MMRFPFLLVLLAVGCGSLPASERWDEVQGGDWVLLRIEGKPVLPGTEFSLTFATGRLYGVAVNRFHANYSRTEEALAIEAVGATKRHLDDPPGAMAEEARYLELLGQADGWKFGGGWLDLTRGGRTVLSFKRRGSTSRG